MEKTVFLFSGQGSQYPKMAEELINSSPKAGEVDVYKRQPPTPPAALKMKSSCTCEKTAIKKPNFPLTNL